MKHRTAIFLSDRTGITAESLGLSLLSQFETVKFTHITLPFIDSVEKAKQAVTRFKELCAADGVKPLVFATIIDPNIRHILESGHAYIIDFFETFIPGLETELHTHSANVSGRIHGGAHSQTYNARIEAVNFALQYDDGVKITGYDSADVILIGVSRCGKTPTSLYLAMQFGIRAANYPLTEEDLQATMLPTVLKPFHKKLFGLTIDPLRLQAIRAHRRPNSRYADPAQCLHEVQTVEAMYRKENIPYLNSTHLSVEELATKLLLITGIERQSL